MELLKINKKGFLVQILFLFLISAIIYLPKIGLFNYYRDDWYYMMDGRFGGPQIFHAMFNSDRPARGYFFDLLYSLFGGNPLPYHLGEYLWHLAAAVAALWLFKMLWPRQSRFAFYMSLLLLIYPGYLWWVAGVEYQPMMVSFFLEVLSIALTVKAVQSPNWVSRALFFAGSILSGWAYLALVEYAIGIEFFRFLCVFILKNRESGLAFSKKLLLTVNAWWLSALAPIGFLFWYLFIFINTRKATDLGIQLGFLQGSAKLTIEQWIVRYFESVLNTSISGWIVPFYQRFWNLSLREMLIGLMIVLPVLLLFWLAWHYQRIDPDEASEIWKAEATLIGLTGIVVGLLPVIIANREVEFLNYSHYGLPLSLAGAMFVAGILAYLSKPLIQFGILSVLVGLATLTHYSVATYVANETEAIRSFWWQVVWRAPGLLPGTDVAVYYPNMEIREDFDNVWGPANLIYSPVPPEHHIPIQYPLAGLSLSETDVERVQLQEGPQWWKYRTHAMMRDFTNVLVMNQPSADSCVQFVDGRWPVLSSSTNSQLAKLASYSRIQTVITGAGAVIPPATVFGPEPEHGWCYYYQKTDLADQQEQWVAAASLADEAIKQKLSPADPVEWLPLLKAYAFTGNAEEVMSLGKLVKKDGLLEPQVCSMFKSMAEDGMNLKPDMQDLISSLFCHN